MNVKTWMKIGGILAALLGMASTLAIAQDYREIRVRERGMYTDNPRPHYRKDYYQRDYYRGSRSYNRHYHQRRSYRDSTRYYQRPYYQRNHGYRHHDGNGYQSK